MATPTNFSTPQPQVVVIQKQSNGCGTAGFVLSLLALFLSWVPVAGWILWFLGFLFSFIGLFKSPRGLAITGFILSFLDLIVLICLIGAISAGVSELLNVSI